MAVVHLKNFGGELPQLNPYSLPPTNAQNAQNLKLWGDSLRPLNGALAVQNSALASNPISIFDYDDTHWFEWLTDVDVRRSPVAGDAVQRVYYTGDGHPKVTYNAIAVTAAPYPSLAYDMGVGAPTDTPTVTLGTGGSGTAETRYYVYTFQNVNGEEGPPSPISAAITPLPGQQVTVGMAAAPAHSYTPYAYRNIYRTNTTGTNKTFQLVAQVAIGTTSYVDTTLTVNLGEVMQSTYWDPPPTDMAGLVSIAGQYFAGFSGNKLCPSEAYFVHGFPADYQVPVDYQIVGLGEFPNGVAILTQGYPYVAVGLDPSALAPIAIRDQAACVAKRSIVSVAGVVVYASPRGLVALSQSGAAQLVTSGVIDDAQWQALNPSTITAWRWRNLYVATCTLNDGTPTGFFFDPSAPQQGLVYFTAVNIGGGYVDLQKDALYISYNRQFAKWDAGNPLNYTWKSRPLELPSPAALNVLRVIASSYPVTVSVYRGSALQARVNVGSQVPVRITNGGLGREYTVQIEGTSDVSELMLTSNMAEMKQPAYRMPTFVT